MQEEQENQASEHSLLYRSIASLVVSGILFWVLIDWDVSVLISGCVAVASLAVLLKFSGRVLERVVKIVHWFPW